MSGLTGTWALVTGASGAVGGAVARALGQAGCSLLLTGRDAARLGVLADELTAAGRRAASRCADLAAPGAAEGLGSWAEAEAGGRLAVLVHAAGAYDLAPVEGTDEAVLDAQLAVNFRAPALLTRRLLPALAAVPGQVVFVTSTAARSAGAGVAAYAAAKSALVAFADSLRAEVNPRGVRVLTVYPGRTASAMQEQVRRLEGRPYEPERLLQPADVAALVRCCLELPRTAEVTEVTIRPALPPR